MAREITVRDIIGHGEMAYGHLYSEAQYEWIKSDVDGYIYLLNTKTQRARRYNGEGQNGHRISIDAYEAAKEAALQIGDWAEREADAIEAAWDDREAIEARDREVQAEREAQVAEAVERLNRQQHEANCYTNIGPDEIEAAIADTAEARATEQLDEVVERLGRQGGDAATSLADITSAMVCDVVNAIMCGGGGHQHQVPRLTSAEDVLAYTERYGWEVEIIEYTDGEIERLTEGMGQAEYIELISAMSARITELVIARLLPPTGGGCGGDCVGIHTLITSTHQIGMHAVLADTQAEAAQHIPGGGPGVADQPGWIDRMRECISGPLEGRDVAIGAVVSTALDRGVLRVAISSCEGRPRHVALTRADGGHAERTLA